MWQKEGGIAAGAANTARGSASNTNIPPPPPWNGTMAGQPFGGHRRSKGLPTPAELAQRIEEARTSAKLLQQLVQSTPQAELKGNDLIKEFADRCQSAQRSVQGYINAENPGPDDDTLHTLIETSEQLSLALSKHSRALLQARRAQGGTGSHSPTPPLPPTRPEDMGNKNDPAATFVPSLPSPVSTYSPPLMPPPTRKPVETNNYLEPDHTYSPPPLPPPSHRAGPTDDNPFADTHAAPDLSDQTNRAVPNVTPSYVRRQDDAEATFTMHGGRDSLPVSPERTSHARGPSLVGEVSPIDTKTRK